MAAVAQPSPNPNGWTQTGNQYVANSPQPAPAPAATGSSSTSVSGSGNPLIDIMGAPAYYSMMAAQAGYTGGGGGGGGGGNNNQQQTTQQNTGGSSGVDQLTSEVSAIFDPVFQALSGQENTLNTNYGLQQQDLSQQYDTSKQSLATQNTQGMNQLGQLGTEAGQTKTDALTAATRLYNELSRGGQQRFGGASSAGEAYGALTAVEQQRRQGTIQTAYDTAMQKVAGYKADLTSKYQDSVAQLESQKQTALTQAQQDFNTALQQIQSAKNQAQSDKASATLNTLQDYRNKVYTINQQSLSFAQQLAANNQLNMKTVDDLTSKVAASISNGQVALTNFGQNATGSANTTTLGIGSANTTSTTPQYTGQISSTGPNYTKYPNDGYTY